MRSVRRWVRRQYAEVRIAPRRRALRAELEQALGTPVALRASGDAGHDSIYRAETPGAVHGVVRLLNPHKKRSPPPAGGPFIRLDGPSRLAQEWDRYTAGSALGLTPRPLWRTDDAILCEYVASTRLLESVRCQASSFWMTCREAAREISRLHGAGLVHMDACLSNILRRESDGSLLFVDFEYAAATDVSIPQQRLYDHLRMVESGLKFVSVECVNGYDDWLQALDANIDASTRDADPAPLCSALTRLLARPNIRESLAQVIPGFKHRATPP